MKDFQKPEAEEPMRKKQGPHDEEIHEETLEMCGKKAHKEELGAGTHGQTLEAETHWETLEAGGMLP